MMTLMTSSDNLAVSPIHSDPGLAIPQDFGIGQEGASCARKMPSEATVQKFKELMGEIISADPLDGKAVKDAISVLEKQMVALGITPIMPEILQKETAQVDGTNPQFAQAESTATPAIEIANTADTVIKESSDVAEPTATAYPTEILQPQSEATPSTISKTPAAPLSPEAISTETPELPVATVSENSKVPAAASTRLSPTETVVPEISNRTAQPQSDVSSMSTDVPASQPQQQTTPVVLGNESPVASPLPQPSPVVVEETPSFIPGGTLAPQSQDLPVNSTNTTAGAQPLPNTTVVADAPISVAPQPATVAEVTVPVVAQPATAAEVPAPLGAQPATTAEAPVVPVTAPTIPAVAPTIPAEAPAVPMAEAPAVPVAEAPAVPVAEAPAVPVAEAPAVPVAPQTASPAESTAVVAEIPMVSQHPATPVTIGDTPVAPQPQNAPVIPGNTAATTQPQVVPATASTPVASEVQAVPLQPQVTATMDEVPEMSQQSVFDAEKEITDTAAPLLKKRTISVDTTESTLAQQFVVVPMSVSQTETTQIYQVTLPPIETITNQALRANLSPELFQAAQGVAQTMKVVENPLMNAREIQIQLQPSILGGAAISVTVANGTLTVSFTTSQNNIALLLERNQPQLVEHLTTQLSNFTNVRIAILRAANRRTEENA